LLLTDDNWTIAEKVLSFLELFYESTVQLSGVYHPTAPLMLHHLILIAKHLKAHEKDKLLRPVVLPMQDVFLKYWMDISMLYSIAFILDPRAKLKGFQNVLRLLSKLTSTDYSAYFTEVRGRLANMFQLYNDKFGAVTLKPPQPPSTGKKKTAWYDIFSSAGDDDDTSDIFSSPGNSFCTPSLPLSRRTPATALLHAASTSASAGVSMGNANELSTYLEGDTVTQFADTFSILNWWHEHKSNYPVLSILARDILTVPVPTISSESTFSTSGRIIEER
jgi:hypothetical protein